LISTKLETLKVKLFSLLEHPEASDLKLQRDVPKMVQILQSLQRLLKSTQNCLVQFTLLQKKLKLLVENVYRCSVIFVTKLLLKLQSKKLLILLVG